MPTSDPATILIEQNHWANRQIFEACATLTEEQFHRRFEMGPGSLHDTLIHILGAMRRWTDMLGRRAARPRLEEGPKRSPAELLSLLEGVNAEWRQEVDRGPLDEVVRVELRGGAIKGALTRGGIVTHVATHGMHHRAQCLNMLRHVGLTPLPPSSVVEWMLMVDAAELQKGTGG